MSTQYPTPRNCDVVHNFVPPRCTTGKQCMEVHEIPSVEEERESLVVLTLDAATFGGCQRCPTCTAIRAPKFDGVVCTKSMPRSSVPEFIWGPVAAGDLATAKSRIDFANPPRSGSSGVETPPAKRERRKRRPTVEDLDAAAAALHAAWKREVKLSNSTYLWKDDPDSEDQIRTRAIMATERAQAKLLKLANRFFRTDRDRSSMVSFRTKKFIYITMSEDHPDMVRHSSPFLMPVPIAEIARCGIRVRRRSSPGRPSTVSARFPISALPIPVFPLRPTSRPTGILSVQPAERPPKLL